MSQPIEPIDGTEEGRAIAAATRAAAKRKHDEVVREPSLAPVKKKGKQQPKATSTHQVAIPEGFDPESQTFDQAVHGEQLQQQLCDRMQQQQQQQQQQQLQYELHCETGILLSN
jgi:hypothetical protein